MSSSSPHTTWSRSLALALPAAALWIVTAAAPAHAKREPKRPMAEQTVKCPRGTRLRKAVHPLGHRTYCVNGANQKHGPYRVWYKSGRPLEYFTYRRGIRHGPFRCWYGWGGMSVRGRYSYGLLAGSFRLWHSRGTFAERGAYRGGQRTGRWTFYTTRGKRDEQGSFVKGERHGRWKRWDKSGKPEGDVCFNRGREVACQ